jgi:hypothetical protein
MLLSELLEANGKTVAVTFGRLNPPTIGHQKLVNAVLKQKADAHYLFVSQTQKTEGKNKTRLSNPLPFDIKLGFIQQAFPEITIGDTSVTTAIGMLQYLEKQGFDKVIFVGGSDRVSDFQQLFDKQNGIDYNFDSIQVVSSGDRDPDAEGAEGMSASKMRAAAIQGDFDNFKTGLPSKLQTSADDVYKNVRLGLAPWISDSKEEQMRFNDIVPEAKNKKPTPLVKNPNPVAKNAMAAVGGGGFGSHKDKKAAMKRGDEKHKKDYAAMAEGDDDWGSMSKRDFKRKELEWELRNEPPNNIQVVINGKPWKVFAGRGRPDSAEEFNHLRKMQQWADSKSAATGKKWHVHLTGAPASK